MDDEYQPYSQSKLNHARKIFAPLFKGIKYAFGALLAVVTVRTIMYVVLRFWGKEAFTKWKFIEPGYFYALFGTEFLVVGTMLTFLYFSTNSKPIEEFQDSD